MTGKSNRVWSWTQPCWVLVLGLLALACGAGEARDIHALDDYALFKRAAGSWEGIGVSFDIHPNGALQAPVTYRDNWEATLAEGGRLMVMNGVTQAGGRRVEYVWRFRWHPKSEKLTAEFENSLGDASELRAEVLADGKRLELRTLAPSGEEKIKPSPNAGLKLDIYLEDEDDLVIEITIRNDEGTEIYRSAARYGRAGKGGGKREKIRD